MIRIPRTHTSCLFGPDQQPAAEVQPGEMVVFETMDAQAGRIQSHADALEVVLPIEEANPVTGPVYVLGARPGETLAVRIVDIQLGQRGLGRVRPGRGVIGGDLRAPAANLIPVHEGMVQFSQKIRFPVRPMVGTIGTAPAGEARASYHPGAHGGNLDLNAVQPGSTVYLPVAVPGALLALGDVHAHMGDGELTGGGIDISAGVTVEISLHRNLGWVRPVIETAAVWCTCGSAPDLGAAIQVATRDMVALLAQKLYLSREESFILVGAAGDIRIGQAAQVGVDQTVCLQISKTVLPSAI